MIVHRIFKKLIQRSRLDEYRHLLEFALQNGYLVTSLSDWYENDFYHYKKVLLLRHDVDLLPSTAYQMFLIEEELGIKSTYYFRWLTANEKIIRKIREAGFEVSLHYETLATFCKRKGIYKQNEITDIIINQCFDELKSEIAIFEAKFGKIKTLCSHGDKRNRIIGTPNHKILDHISRKDLGIYFETYDPSIISKIDVYISDSSINENHNWKYGISPIEAMESGTRCICILTHPHHWQYSLWNNLFRLFYDLKDFIGLG